MVALETPKLVSGWKAIDFFLKATDGGYYDLQKARGEKGLLVMFICNHCPYVKAILDNIIRDTAELRQYGIGSIAIMANDPTEYLEDSFENMQRLSQEKEFPFPYVVDETQQTAKDYGAVCTPDFFGFNNKLELEYRGRLDASQRNTIPDAKRELFEAMVMIAKTGKGPDIQVPSIGCSIKWIAKNNLQNHLSGQ